MNQARKREPDAPATQSIVRSVHAVVLDRELARTPMERPSTASQIQVLR
jgi:hypothetical protein